MPRDEKNDNVALLDMDGTVVAFDKALSFDLQQVIGNDQVSEETQERIKSLIKKQPGWWFNLEPIQLGLSIAEKLRQIGFRVMVATKGPVRTTSAWTEKVEWCRKYLPFADITVTHDKSLLYGKILVDDWPDYIEPWLRWRPRGLVLMPAQKWNEGFKHEQVIRVENEQQLFALDDTLREVYAR